MNRKKYHNKATKWSVTALLLVTLISIPFLALFGSLNASSLLRIPHSWIQPFAFNTYLLLLGTGVLSLLFGVPTAWFISTYQFLGRKWLDWMLVLPLSIPAYIQVYTYKGILGPFGTMQKWTGSYFDVENELYLMVFMSSVLYPYVYLASKTAFSYHSGRLTEAVQSLGGSNWKAFYKVVLPLARPAIFGGLFLVLMEVFNNYGAVSYFGIKTFTTEIVRLWNPLDLQPVLTLSVAVLLLVLLLLFLEKFAQRKAKYTDDQGIRPVRKQLSGSFNLGALLICMIPLILGFLIPVAQLIGWSFKVIDKVLTSEFLILTFNTFKTAFFAAIACVLVAMIIQYAMYLSRSKLFRNSIQLSNLGYAVPGAVIGVGVLFPLAWLNQQMGWLLTGSVVVLIFAYVVRFLSASNNLFDAGFKKIPTSLHEAAISLGKTPLQTLFSIHLPLLKPVILSAGLLVFVDVTKELPLTMLFHSFNFETLAVRAFILMETDGAVYDSSVPALIIIMIGIVPAVLLNKMMRK